MFYVPRKLNIKPDLNRNEPITEPATILRERPHTHYKNPNTCIFFTISPPHSLASPLPLAPSHGNTRLVSSHIHPSIEQLCILQLSLAFLFIAMIVSNWQAHTVFACNQIRLSEAQAWYIYTLRV